MGIIPLMLKFFKEKKLFPFSTKKIFLSPVQMTDRLFLNSASTLKKENTH